MKPVENVFRCMIVPESIAAHASALAAAFGPTSAGMFAKPIPHAPGSPVTHRFSEGCISQEFAAALPLMRQNAVGEWVNTMPEPGAFAALCEQAGIDPPPPETLTAIFAQVDVSEQRLHEAMTRMGLTPRPADMQK